MKQVLLLTFLIISCFYNHAQSFTPPADGGAINKTKAAPATPPAQKQATLANSNDDSLLMAMPKTTISIDNQSLDLGEMIEGTSKDFTYIITNTGTNPLKIGNVKGSCGCTVPTWPKEPIAPGASAEIKAKFNSKGKKGNQNKTITVKSNTDPLTTILTFKVKLIPDPNAPLVSPVPDQGAPIKQQITPMEAPSENKKDK